MNIEEIYKIFKKQHQKITTDSRKIEKGIIFWALKGDNFDGNKFADTALAEGAAYAVVDNPSVATSPKHILVEDTLKALQNLATHHRRQFDMPIICIAGSNGKTTTKELVAAVMSSHYDTHFTRGNFNNHIGVPLTLLQLNAEHEAAIIEIGANHLHETHELCCIAEPTHGLVTNMGKDHLEGFGSFEGVLKANSEIYEWLAQNRKTVFVNEDEPYLKECLPAEGLHKIFYQRTETLSMQTPQYQARLESADPFLKISFQDENGDTLTLQTQIVGEYNFANILTAIAIGKYFKVPAFKIRNAISSYVPSMNRSQLLKHASGATIILDAYNANPSSMLSALKSFAKLSQPNKVAIIGDMLEMGEASAQEHRDMQEFAKSLNFNKIIFVGKEFGAVYEAADNTLYFDKNTDAKAWFEQQQFDENTAIFLKGSRGIKLEIIVS